MSELIEKHSFALIFFFINVTFKSSKMNEVEKKQRMRPVNQHMLKKPMVEFDNKRSL